MGFPGSEVGGNGANKKLKESKYYLKMKVLFVEMGMLILVDFIF